MPSSEPAGDGRRRGSRSQHDMARRFDAPTQPGTSGPFCRKRVRPVIRRIRRIVRPRGPSSAVPAWGTVGRSQSWLAHDGQIGAYVYVAAACKDELKFIDHLKIALARQRLALEGLENVRSATDDLGDELQARTSSTSSWRLWKPVKSHSTRSIPMVRTMTSKERAALQRDARHELSWVDAFVRKDRKPRVLLELGSAARLGDRL